MLGISFDNLKKLFFIGGFTYLFLFLLVAFTRPEFNPINYWDQPNTNAGQPVFFFFSLLVTGVCFSIALICWFIDDDEKGKVNRKGHKLHIQPFSFSNATLFVMSAVFLFIVNQLMVSNAISNEKAVNTSNKGTYQPVNIPQGPMSGLKLGESGYETASDISDKPSVQPAVQQNVNTSNTVDCTGPDGKHLQITQKECDDFNNAWNKPKVVPQPNPINVPRPSNSTQTSPSSTNYPPCTVNYTYGGPYTYYYMTPEQCSAEQSRANSSNTSNSVNVVVTPYATPTLSLSEQQAIIDQHNNQVRQCQSDVTHKYSEILQNCSSQFGNSSAYDACISVNSGYKQNEYDSCGQIIN